MPDHPAAYTHWQIQLRRLLEPLSVLMQPGRADLAIAGTPSDHDAQADRLESFARPLLLASFYLQSAPLEPTADANISSDPAFREKIAFWFRSALVAGADPTSKQSWGPDASYHQHHVEMGLLAIALQLAPAATLDAPETRRTRPQVARWFATCRGGGIVNNNHLFMSVHILEFLGKQGYAHRTDRAVITAHLNQLETMHRGGGWFEDGINQAYDHYNAYAFHFYGLMWARLHRRRTTRPAPRAGAIGRNSSSRDYAALLRRQRRASRLRPQHHLSFQLPQRLRPRPRRNAAPISPPACCAGSARATSTSSCPARSTTEPRLPRAPVSPISSEKSSEPYCAARLTLLGRRRLHAAPPPAEPRLLARRRSSRCPQKPPPVSCTS